MYSIDESMLLMGFPVVLVVKNPLPDVRDGGSIPGSERSPAGGIGDPLQYSCLENPIDREVWWVTVPGVIKELDMTEVTEHADMHDAYVDPFVPYFLLFDVLY